MHPFHDRYIGKVHYLVQVNRFGIWHGYINCMYQDTFDNEDQAKVWLKAR